VVLGRGVFRRETLNFYEAGNSPGRDTKRRSESHTEILPEAKLVGSKAEVKLSNVMKNVSCAQFMQFLV